MDPRKISLAIYLLKEKQVDTFHEAFPSHGTVPLIDPLEGYFLPFPPRENRVPTWVADVGSLLAQPVTGRMNAASPGGLLVVRRSTKTFVIAFGHAWQKLEEVWLEPDFGLRIALNAIPKANVVEIRAEQVFAKWHISSERAPKASSIREFGVDFDRDLVGAVEGVPKRRPELGSKVRGSTCLRVMLPIAELPATLDVCLAEFANKTYQVDWPEIDKVTPVEDEDLVSILDSYLEQALSDETARRHITMFTPSQRRGDMGLADSFVFGRLSKSPVKSPYLTVDSWISSLAAKQVAPSVEMAKRSTVHLLDDGGEEIRECTAYDCFGFEYSDGTATYILTSGTWYEVRSNFIKDIDGRIAKIPKPSCVLPKWNGEREEDYNKACAKTAGFLNVDTKNIHFGGAQSKFEFCDLVHLPSKTLVFAKIVSRSSNMSHLLEQARRTAELVFGVDGEFRKLVHKMLVANYPHENFDWLKTRPRPGDLNLCLVSLGRSRSAMPFFAKCGLAKLHKELCERSHSVSFVAV